MTWLTVQDYSFKGDVALQFLGTEVQKTQDVMVSVTILRKAQRTGSIINPNVMCISIIGAHPIPVATSYAAMLEGVNAWQTG